MEFHLYVDECQSIVHLERLTKECIVDWRCLDQMFGESTNRQHGAKCERREDQHALYTHYPHTSSCITTIRVSG